MLSTSKKIIAIILRINTAPAPIPPSKLCKKEPIKIPIFPVKVSPLLSAIFFIKPAVDANRIESKNKYEEKVIPFVIIFFLTNRNPNRAIISGTETEKYPINLRTNKSDINPPERPR